MTAAVLLSDGSYLTVSGDDPAIPAGTADTVDVVPGRPGADRDPAGQPAVRLWDLGATTLLQVGAGWPVQEDEIRRTLPQLLPGHRLTGRLTRIQIAVQGTPRLAVLVTATDGERRVIAETDSSGYPPFAAALTQPVDDTAAAAIRAALDGERGRTFVQYHADLSPTLVVDAAVLRGSSTLTIRRGASGLLTATACRDLADLGAPPAHPPSPREGRPAC